MNNLTKLIHPNDPYQMDWIQGVQPWGTVICPDGIYPPWGKEDNSEAIDHPWGDTSCNDGLVPACVTTTDGDVITQKFVFTNTSKKHIFTSLTDVAIFTPFNDDYTSADICRTQRCNTHIWCGENVSYVMALRMGGEAPHLGLVLTKGSLGGYSIQRDLSKQSNDRGDFMLHPSPAVIAPGERMEIEWKLFWHEGKEDFYKKAAQLNPKFISISCPQYVLFPGEEIQVEIAPAFPFDPESVSITLDSCPVDYRLTDGKLIITGQAQAIGERRYEIEIGGVKTHCCLYVHEELETLAKNRCYFIAEKQQYQKPGDKLDGAYLCYDNEEQRQAYSAWYDWNAGRERIGMGLLMIEYLKTHTDPVLTQSLAQHTVFVEREMVNLETGVVANDYGQTVDFLRLYDYPWFAQYFVELYDLYRKPEHLDTACKIMDSFYAQNGKNFYAFEMPVCKLMGFLKETGRDADYSRLLAHFEEHSQIVIDRGLSYPAHEVNYEQSIVAPATDLLLQMYELTGEEKYLTAGKIQLDVLALFNGLQPDYHLNEVAIRHWDGFWFGKRKQYGDTFPHYWSALTAIDYERYGKATGCAEYLHQAELSYRGVLPMIQPDGSASCAYLYPVTINGNLGKYYDPWANDQDWGLYFMLRHKNG